MKFSQEISIFKPHAIEYEVVSLGSRITQTASEIRLETEQKLTNYSTTIEMNAAISVLPHTITLGVSGRAGKNTSASITVSLYDSEGNLIDDSSGNIYIDGEVVFSSQLTDGTTRISGSNIKTGTIQGASLILGGQSNANGTISMRNSSNVEIGTWTNSGLTVTNPNTLRTSITTDGKLHVHRYSSNAWKEIGNVGYFQLDKPTRTGTSGTAEIFGINAIPSNTAGLAICINGVPYYAMNTSTTGNEGFDLTGYGYRHYFNGDIFCKGMFKTSCGYGWAGTFGDDDRPIIFTGANVRIENYDDNGHLFVASSIRTDGTCSAGYMWSDGGYGESDRRVKENIVSLDASKSSSLIMGLKPVQFNYIKTPDSLRHGFIAQDVEEIADWDVVGENDQGIKGLLYTDLIADMVAVIQKQEERIADLERRIANG